MNFHQLVPLFMSSDRKDDCEKKHLELMYCWYDARASE